MNVQTCARTERIETKVFTIKMVQQLQTKKSTCRSIAVLDEVILLVKAQTR